MRLIDADKLKEAICEYVHRNDEEIPCNNQIESCLWSKVRVCDFARIVYNQPTAYNPEKVVEQINDVVEYYDKTSKLCMDAGNFRSSDRETEKMCVAIKCREIVEKGGKEWEN